MTCDDCLHICVCEWAHIPPDPEKCEDFKNRARFLELPCKLGDAVWYFYRLRGKYIMREYMVKSAVYDCDGLFVLLAENGGNGRAVVSSESFGDCVFLTREEAEAALAERRATHE